MTGYSSSKGCCSIVHLMKGEIKYMERFLISNAQKELYTFSEKLMCNLIVLYLDQLFPTSLVVNSKFRKLFQVMLDKVVM